MKKLLGLILIVTCSAAGNILMSCSDNGNGNGQDSGTQDTTNAENPNAIGQSSVEIDTRTITTHVGEAAVGTFFADIYKDAIEAKGKSVDVVFVNAGGIRGGDQVGQMGLPLGALYPAGDITEEQVGSWLPFDNSTDILTLTGVQLKSVLERGSSALPPDLKNDAGGWFLQVSGMKYTITCANTAQQITGTGCTLEDGFDPCDISTPGTRITKMEVGGNVVYDVDQSIDELASLEVKVGAFSFLTGGLDGHLAFRDGANKETIQQTDLDLKTEVINYIKNNSPISPKTDGRITIVGDCGKPGTTP